jgi:hypothetical protein
VLSAVVRGEAMTTAAMDRLIAFADEDRHV